MLKKTKWSTAIVAVYVLQDLFLLITFKPMLLAMLNQILKQYRTLIGLKGSTTEKKAPAFNKSDYLSSNPKIIRLKHNATIYKYAALTQVDHQAKKGYHYLTSKLVTPTDSAPVLKLSNGKYISAKKSLIAKVKGYQNPKGYLTHKSSLTVMPATTFIANMKVLKLGM